MQFKTPSSVLKPAASLLLLIAVLGIYLAPSPPWAGMSTAVCLSLFIVSFYVPAIKGLPLVILQGYSFLVFLFIFTDIALGLRRYRLFDLGNWAFRIISHLFALAGFTVLDGLIVSLQQLQFNFPLANNAQIPGAVESAL